MKFLCMTCDDPMSLDAAKGPDEGGSMSVVFHCDGCGWKMAMLTNPWETQVVSSLGVKVGGQSEQAPPMETLRTALSGVRPELEHVSSPRVDAAVAALPDDAPKCPFSAMMGGTTTESAEATESTNHGLPWAPDADARFDERIPSFIRPMARVAIEKFAKEKGLTEITVGVLEEARELFVP